MAQNMTVSVNLNGADTLLGATPEAVIAAKIYSFTKTAVAVRDKQKEVIPTTFDGTVAWTRNAPFAVAATQFEPNRAKAWLKDTPQAVGTPAGEYLKPQVAGGERPHTPWERLLIARDIMPPNYFAVIARSAPKDANGNINSAIYVAVRKQILEGAMARGELTQSGRVRRRQNAMSYAYFVHRVGGGGYSNSRLIPGIYQRLFLAGRIRAIWNFTRRPIYREKYGFHEIAYNVIDAVMIEKFDEELARRLASIR